MSTYFRKLVDLEVLPYERESRLYKELLRATYLLSELDPEGTLSKRRVSTSILRAAKSLALTPEEYLLRRSQGWRRCPKCREFKPESAYRTLTGPCSCAAHHWS